MKEKRNTGVQRKRNEGALHDEGRSGDNGVTGAPLAAVHMAEEDLHEEAVGGVAHHGTGENEKSGRVRTTGT